MANPEKTESANQSTGGGKAGQLRVFDGGRDRKVNARKEAVRWGPYRDLGRVCDLEPLEALRKDCPRRPIDWRWQRTQYAVDRDEHIPQSENDIRMAKALRFLELIRRRCKCEDDIVALANREPFNSILLAVDLANADDELTSVVQARLLTRDSYPDLSKRLGYSPQAIEWYHDLFFDVRGHLDTPTYILHHAIGPHTHLLQFDDLKTYWKMMAYIGGPKVLDAVVNPLSGAATDPDVIRFFRTEFRMLLRIRASFAARLVETNDSREAARFLRAWQRSEEIETRLSSRIIGEPTDIDRNVAAFFAELDRCYDTHSAEFVESFDLAPEVNSQSNDDAVAFQSTEDVYLEDPLLLE